MAPPRSPRIRINDVPVLGTSRVIWRLREGLLPVVETFEVTPEGANRLRDQVHQPATLRIEVAGELGDAVDLEFRNLWIVEFPPATSPRSKAVRLADLRWWWSYAHVLRRYNIRRNVGFKRIAATSTPELQPVDPDIWYARWSLRNPGQGAEGRWRAREVLEDVLEELRRKLGELGAPMRFTFVAQALGREVPIQDLELDDSGEAALGRALAHLPQAAVTVDPDGEVRVYSRVSGGEREMVKRAGSEIVGEGHVELVRNSAQRPLEVHVLFSREIEVRFDFDEQGPVTVVASAPEQLGAGSNSLKNVLAVPDHTLTLRSGQQVAQGTWLAIETALDAWNSQKNSDGEFGVLGIGPLTMDLIRQYMIPQLNLWAGVAVMEQFDETSDWLARIAAVQQHFRRTLQIDRRWMDRILSVRAYRVATVNPETGTRGPAVAFSDYCVIPSQKYYARKVGEVPLLGINVRNYPEAGVLGKTSRPAPVNVSVVDEDQGIIHLEYLLDPIKLYDHILPSRVDNLPMINLSNPIAAALGWEVIPDIGKAPELSKNHKVAVILTVLPGSPNSNAQLHRIIVKPEEIADLLTPAAQEGLRDANGPPMEVRVGSGVEVARVRWLDGSGTTIERLLGVGAQEGAQPPAQRELEQLVLNEGTNRDPEGGASLNQIARAWAARIYGSLADRVEGRMAGRITGSVQPEGWLDEVAFVVDESGVAKVELQLPEKVPALDLFSILDDSTRAIVMRLAQPG